MSSLAMSLKNHRTLEEIVQVLVTTIEDITASIEELAAMATELAKNMKAMDKMREESYIRIFPQSGDSFARNL